jgi:FG-GAP-like repeat/Secretion system C-terminal sorting domain
MTHFSKFCALTNANDHRIPVAVARSICSYVIIAFVIVFFLPLQSPAQPTWNKQVLSELPDGPITVHIVDFDLDGDEDVLSSSWFSDQITWTEQTESDWIGHVLVEDFDGNRGCFPADIDSDGDVDFVGAAFYADEIAWWENDNSVWTKHLISNNFNGAVNVYCVDMDGDEDLDIVGTCYWGGTIAWWENRQGAFWPRHNITTTFPGAYAAKVIDIDLDGDLDILGTSESGDRVGLWENTGNGWTEILLSSSMYSTRCVEAADMDNDGDIDIVAAAVQSDEICWWENDNGSWNKRIVSSNHNGSRHISLVDLDQDGDMDIVSSALWVHECAWFEQDGSNWVKHVIATDINLAKGIDTADIDGDGDIDVVGCSYQNDQIIVFEHIPEPNPDPVSLELAPSNTTQVQGGSNLYFDAILTFDIAQAENYVIWTEIVTPEGERISPTLYVELYVTPGMVIDAPGRRQYIDNSFLPGEYQYILYAGRNIDHADQGASFEFSVVGNQVMSLDQFDTPSELFSLSEVGPPTEASLTESYPNPFNASTSFEISLPEAASGNVLVYNISGQEVATLADGPISAGVNRFTFDASYLSSGLYFVRVSVPGHLEEIQKVTLIR